MVGVAVPLFSGSIRSNIESAEVLVQMQENQLQIEQKNWSNQVQQINNEIDALDKVLTSYQSVQWPETQLLQQTISQQLLSGEINYLDWVVQNDQVIQIQNQFADQLLQRNQSVITFNFLTNE